MMKRKIVAFVATAGLALGLTATAASAGGPPAGAGERGKPAGITCMQYGLGGLRSLGPPPLVVQDLVDAGALPDLSLSEVLALHREDPATANVVLKSLGFPAGEVDAACPTG